MLTVVKSPTEPRNNGCCRDCCDDGKLHRILRQCPDSSVGSRPVDSRAKSNRRIAYLAHSRPLSRVVGYLDMLYVHGGRRDRFYAGRGHFA